jgi:ABC-type uncharacterized transport system ATPase subunit
MLARAMTGRDLNTLPPKTTMRGEGVEPVLSVRNLVVHAGTRVAMDGVSFDAYPGEILGAAGVEGNGQRELLDSLVGLTAVSHGEVLLDGRDVTHASPQARHEAGLSGIHEDRQGWGLVLDMTAADNLALASVPAGRFSRRGLLRRKAIREHARRLLVEYDVRPANPDLPVRSLSGGNQQKLVLARELSRDPRVLVAANPTQGLDVGAAEYVHRQLLDVREKGNAIVLVSHDLDELLKLSDRILVLYRGRILYEAAVEDVSMDDLALAMAGVVPGSRVEKTGQDSAGLITG